MKTNGRPLKDGIAPLSDVPTMAASALAGARQRPKIVALDQNKWIDLARAVEDPKGHRRDRDVLELLCAKVEVGEVRLPLTASNLYETHKVSDHGLRALIAETQATLSRSEVFRGRRKRLEIEISRALCQVYDLAWTEPDPDWVFSTLFFESHAELGDPRLEVAFSDRVLTLFRKNPPGALFNYLAHLDEATRREAVARFERGADQLRSDIETRRAQHRNQSVSMRRKIYSVLLVLGDQDAMIAAADLVGLPWRCFEDNKGATMRRVVKETPTLLIERELVLKLEGQRGDLEVNDLRDMQNFITTLPYADIVVAEIPFTNLARQAGLADRFRARLETDLQVLHQLL